MHKELFTMSYLAERLNLPDIAKMFTEEAEQLIKALHEHCWYSEDC